MEQSINKKVLVVDDEDSIRLFLKTALVNAGFTVETAADGFEALAKVQANPPDAISLDLVMPKKSGAKFLYELHKNKEWQRIPVIIVTAHAQDDLGKQDFDDIMSGRMLMGPETYLEKPVKADSYVNSIKRVLGIDIEESTPAPEAVQNEIKSLLDTADPKQLEEALKILKKK